MRGFALLVCYCFALELLAQSTKPGPRPIGAAYENLRPEQQKLVDDLAKRFSRQTNHKLPPNDAYDNAPQSIRTTFDAVTHALLTTKLTDPAGNKLGVAFDVIDAVEEVAGQRPGESGDQQFRVYFFLKPNAAELLERSTEFERGPDNTVFHKGYPTSYRMPGTPSIQFSISRDGKTCDVDVDYRSSGFPQGLVNGHLTASNSDVRAGKNEQKHNGRWNGLVAWWSDLFSWNLPSLREENQDGERIPELSSPPKVSSGNIEDATKGFYNLWLVKGDAPAAASFFSREAYACAERRAQSLKQPLERGMTVFYISQRLAAHNKVDPPGGTIASHSSAIEPWDPSLKQKDHAEAGSFLLLQAGPDFAEAHDCSVLADPEAKRGKTKGNFFVTISRLKGYKDPTNLQLLWTKQSGFWKIISFEVIEHGKPDVFTTPTTRSKASEVKTVEVDGDPEMVKAVETFFDLWMVKRKSAQALSYLLPEAVGCVAEPGKRSPADAKKAIITGMDEIAREVNSRSVKDAVNAPDVQHDGLRVVRHKQQDEILIVSLADQAEGLLRCGAKVSQTEVEKRADKTGATFGKLYLSVVQIEEQEGYPAVLMMAWRSTPQGWRAFWWKVESH